jgi:hypothetical protein
LVLQAKFRYSVTLFVNENGYIVGAQVTTGNSTCIPSNERENQAEYSYKVTMRLQLNDVGPQYEETNRKKIIKFIYFYLDRRFKVFLKNLNDKKKLN